MIKNDFRYIIKKIIIGLGIFIGIFYFKSCNVNASGDKWYNMHTPVTNSNIPFQNMVGIGSNLEYILNGNSYKVEYRSNGLFINNNLVYNGTNFDKNAWFIGIDSSNNVHLIYSSVSSHNDTFTYYINSNSDMNNFNFPFDVSKVELGCFKYSHKIDMLFTNGQFVSRTDTSLGNCGGVVSNNLTIYGSVYRMALFKGSNPKYYSYSNLSDIYVSSSTINSLNATSILSDDNSVLLGYNFRLNFDNFNTDNFIYKYRVGNSRTLILNNNNYDLSIRNNDTLYVWVEDLEGNVIDNETFTIVGVGNLYEGEYSIEFNYKDIAPSDTENTTGLSNIIDRVDIDITYLPKTNKLKYQYQYVNSDGSLDPQNWTQLNNDNSVNEYTYVVHDNGTLYARILDENDEVVANNTFSVDSIGKIKLFNDNNNVGGIFDNIKNNINYSGPIYSLILMPINFINTIYSNSSSTCQRYKLGTLLNNDIYFECVDFSNYLGSDLYHLIDILCASGVIYGIALFIKKKYNQFTSLSDNDNDIM